MAKAGARVLVVERETRFQDRVRGEFMEPWGVAETRRLGIYDAIRGAANDNPFWQIYIGEKRFASRRSSRSANEYRCLSPFNIVCFLSLCQKRFVRLLGNLMISSTIPEITNVSKSTSTF
jgi:hypothetical protein